MSGFPPGYFRRRFNNGMVDNSTQTPSRMFQTSPTVLRELQNINRRLSNLEISRSDLCFYCNSSRHKIANCPIRLIGSNTQPHPRYKVSRSNNNVRQNVLASTPPSFPSSGEMSSRPDRVKFPVTRSVAPDLQEEDGGGQASSSQQQSEEPSVPDRPETPMPGQASGSSSPPSEYRLARIFLVLLFMFPVLISANNATANVNNITESTTRSTE